MKRKILDMQDLYVPCSTPVLLGKFLMKRPSDMPLGCSIIEINPGPERICILKGDDRRKIRAAMDRYLKNLHQQVWSLHSNLTDETRVPPLGPPPWKEKLWVGTTEGVPFRIRTRRPMGDDHCTLFFISGQRYYHIPFMEWVMKKLFKMSGLTPGSNFEFMAKGVQVHRKKPG